MRHSFSESDINNRFVEIVSFSHSDIERRLTAVNLQPDIIINDDLFIRIPQGSGNEFIKRLARILSDRALCLEMELDGYNDIYIKRYTQPHKSLISKWLHNGNIIGSDWLVKPDGSIDEIEIEVTF